MDNSDYEGGHTGQSIFFETMFTEPEKSNFSFKSRPFNTQETCILLRYHSPGNHFTAYPQIGFGACGSHGN